MIKLTNDGGSERIVDCFDDRRCSHDLNFNNFRSL